MYMLQNLFSALKKYNIFHIFFWICVYISLFHETQQRHPLGTYGALTICAFTVLITAWSVYFIIYALVPKYFNKQSYGKFLMFSLLSVIIFSLFNSLLQDLLLDILYNKRLRSYTIYALVSATDIIIYASVFFAVVTIPQTYLTSQRNKQLEKERLETELSFLKSQINPHFLFNALNSIYVLIEEDKKMAADTLLKFSDMLRYQLYDCSGPLMPLGKELAFLHDYAALEKMRNSQKLNVSFDIQKDMEHISIPPFILLPFIENAFKHISRYTGKLNFINIHFSTDQNTFIFSVANSFEKQDTGYTHQEGGIGLQNVKRRLELLYPEKHTLDIQEKEGIYSVRLKLERDGNEMYNS